MNTCILDLAKQADCTIDGMGYGEGNLEQFAKLIIRECARVDSEANNPDHEDGVTYNYTILEHFGVGE